MIAEIAAANAAFQVIKSAIKNSGEIASAGKAVIDYFSATSKIEEEVKKTPARKRSDLEEFLALEQLRKQEQELKELLIYSGRPGLWDDFQAFRVKARQNREAEEREVLRKQLAEKARKKETFRKHYADPLDDRPSGHASWYCGACPLSIFGDQMIPLAAILDVGSKLIDKLIPDPEAKARAQVQLLEMQQRGELAQLQADSNEQDNLTKRAEADMASDSWLSKNIRPMTLIFILMAYTVFGLMSAWEIEVNQAYVELLGQWGMLIMSFYFGGRTLEKILAMKEKK
jgi:hypothetical protein